MCSECSDEDRDRQTHANWSINAIKADRILRGGWWVGMGFSGQSLTIERDDDE